MSALSDLQKDNLKSFLCQEVDIFARNPMKPGVSDAPPHRIEIISNHRPVRSQYYSVSPAEDEVIIDAIDKMLANGICSRRILNGHLPFFW